MLPDSFVTYVPGLYLVPNQRLLLPVHGGRPPE